MRKIIITSFFVILTLPPLAGLIFNESAFFKEKPSLSPLPAFSAGALLDPTFYNGIERYLDDRNPLRGIFIMSKNWLDVRIFQTTTTPKVHIGLKGWLYFRPAIESFFKADCEAHDRALKLAWMLHNMELELNRAGKQFVFIVAPNKATIYPEYIGGVPEPNGCGKNFYDLFLEALRKYPVNGFVRLDKAFKETKGPPLLYSKTGTHWNDRGAELTGELILKKLSTQEASYHMPKMNFRDKIVSSDFSHMLSVEVKNKITVADNIQYKSVVKTYNIEPHPSYADHWIKLITTAQAPADSQILPTAVVYRDSFMKSPIKLLKGSFKVIYARWSSIFPVADYDDYKAVASSKIIMIEIVERDLSKLEIRPRLLKAIINTYGTSRYDG